MIAYEPVWAIGTGFTASPEQADAIHDLIRRQIGEYDPALAKRTLHPLWGQCERSQCSRFVWHA